MGGYVSSFLCNVVGATYPVYASFKAIESTDKEDDTQWLTYWVVFSVYSILESFTDYIIFWFPFYYEVKLIILVLLQIPSLKLSAALYKTYISPFLYRHQTDIDGFIAHEVDALKTKAKAVGKDILTKHGPEIVGTLLSATATANAERSTVVPEEKHAAEEIHTHLADGQEHKKEI